jgi:hypothetical protein
MYGVEAATSGAGGLAAQAPPDVYFPQALGIANTQSAVSGTPPSSGVTVPFSAQGEIQTPTAFAGEMSPPATPVSQVHSSWSSVLDFHNSVAPWVLLGILVLYGWIHVSARASAGPAKAAAVL